MSRRVLISTHGDDLDAKIIANQLRERGLSVDFFVGTDYPMRSRITHRLGMQVKTTTSVTTAEAQIDLQGYDVVWWRRYTGFGAVHDLHPDDEELVAADNRLYARQFPFLLSPGARWINSPAGEIAGSSKVLQLQVAKRADLRFPDTLVTNDREEALAFIVDARRRGQSVVFKTAYPHHWQAGDGAEFRYAYAYTTPVSEADLVDESVFRVCAGIFQIRCDSQYEVRAVFMGSDCKAIAFNDASDKGRQLDSRRAPSRPEQARRHMLPMNVHQRCADLLRELGLVFGSIDLLVDADGEYVFLEINPQGQFLWMDDVCPGLDVKRAFCDFVECGVEQRHQASRDVVADLSA